MCILSHAMTTCPRFGRFSYHSPAYDYIQCRAQALEAGHASRPLLWNLLPSSCHPSMAEITLQRLGNVLLSVRIEWGEQGSVDLIKPHVSWPLLPRFCMMSFQSLYRF